MLKKEIIAKILVRVHEDTVKDFRTGLWNEIWTEKVFDLSSEVMVETSFSEDFVDSCDRYSDELPDDFYFLKDGMVIDIVESEGEIHFYFPRTSSYLEASVLKGKKVHYDDRKYEDVMIYTEFADEESFEKNVKRFFRILESAKKENPRRLKFEFKRGDGYTFIRE